MSETTKPDGRRNNGSKPGEARKKKYADVGKPTRKKVCYYLSPKHVAAIEARGKGMTATISEALDLLFAMEGGQK